MSLDTSAPADKSPLSRCTKRNSMEPLQMKSGGSDDKHEERLPANTLTEEAVLSSMEVAGDEPIHQLSADATSSSAGGQRGDKRWKDFEEKTADHEAEIGALGAPIVHLDAQIENLEAQIEDLYARNAVLEKEIDELASEVARRRELELQNRRLQEQLQELSNIVDDWMEMEASQIRGLEEAFKRIEQDTVEQEKKLARLLNKM